VNIKLMRELRRKEKEATKARTVLMWVSSAIALPSSLVSCSLSIIYVMRECDLTIYHVMLSWFLTLLLGVYLFHLARKVDDLEAEVMALKATCRMRCTYR